MKIRKISLLIIFIILFGCTFSSICLSKTGYSRFKLYSYNENVSGLYDTDVYGSPHGEFMVDEREGKVSKDGKQGEYQYLGYNFEEKEFPNDRWFGKSSNRGKIFSKNYSDVEWIESNPEAFDSWEKINNDPELIEYMATAKFYDSDHITKGETNTGKSIIDLFGQDNYQNYAIVISAPTKIKSGHLKFFYKKSGASKVNYNTIVIKPIPYIECIISADADTMTIPKGQKQDVKVEIDTNQSLYRLYGESYNDFIKREYWVGKGDVIDSEKVELVDGEYTATVENISPGDTITIWSKVYSDELKKLGYEHTAEATLELYIGERLPPQPNEYDLDYNILSREVLYPLSDNEITARLVCPRGWWSTNAFGGLNVINKSPRLFEEFFVGNNPIVNEDNSTIRRNPEIQAKFHRRFFGDDPENRVWSNHANPLVPMTEDGIVSYNGGVSRKYSYIYFCYSDNCFGHDGFGRAEASFNSGENIKTIRTFIYNGMPVVAPKIFENRIANNHIDSENKEMYWTSEPYHLNVIRWMYHMDSNRNLYNPTPVDGQYKRIFTQQCRANIEWDTNESMEQKYEISKLNSENAVFASDKDFKNIDYPIKSGYYFNPCGKYEFTVETVTYKMTKADTKDHKDLVDAVINSFRYESDLMYTDKNNNAVNLQNESLSKVRNNYARKSASLTAQDPTGVDGITMLNVLDRDDDAWRYSKTVEEFYHSQNESGNTNKLLKEILEGYVESGTASSYGEYKYKEYLKTGQYIYKITEKTTVTIYINQQNRKVYTHAHMPDGKYTVKAWIGDIDLSGMNGAYKRLGILKGFASLDEIEVSVKGSLFGDISW